jgi:1,4-alpha-glucan branching enzyme
MNKPPSKNKSSKQGSIPFTFPASAAQQVSVAGDFNNWDTKSLPMHKGAEGVWHLNVALRPGRHEYRFIADGVWLDNPITVQKVVNAMGTENCVITVAG